jgi:PAS domain S-box-containing protein
MIAVYFWTNSKVNHPRACVMNFPVHPNEVQRLSALTALQIMDTPPEERFDAVVRLAAKSFDVPIALISFIDAERQWFKARCGMELPETLRGLSFCTHTIMSEDILVIPDATQDDRVCHNPFVTGDAGVRFYAGAPLVLRPGVCVGTLCIVDAKPRNLSDEERQTLKDLASVVVAHLTLCETKAELQAKTDLLEATLEHMDQGLLVMDGEHRVAVSNRRAVELLGLPDDLMRGRPLFEDVRRYQARSGEFEYAPDEVMDLVRREGFTSGPQVYERVRPNGTALEVRTVATPEGGAVRTYTDISARHRVEQELRASEERYRALVKASASMVWRAAPDGSIVGGDGWEDFTGQYPVDARGHGWLSAIHPDDQARVVARWREIVASGEPGENRYRARRADGEYRWMLSRGAPVKNPDGTIREWVGTVTDVHEHTIAREELAKSEERFRDFTEIGSDWFWETDADHRYTSVAGRPTVVPFLGKTRWERMGADPKSPEWAEHIRCVHAHQPFHHFEYTAVLNGHTYHLSSSGKPLFDPDGRFVGYRGVTADITARKEAELLAAEKAALLAATLDNMDQGLMMFDASEIIQVYNDRAAELLGMPKELLAQRPTFRQLVAYQVQTEEFVRGDEAVRRYADGINGTRHTYERERPDGSILEIRTVPLPAGGAVRTYTDVTARRKAEAELKDSEARYRLLAENSTDLIARTDLNGVRLYLSPASRELLGYEPAELIGSELTGIIHPDDQALAVSSIAELLAHPEREQTVTYRLQHKDGRWVWLESRRKLVRDADGKPVEFVSVGRDVTQRLLLEEQLRQSQKMEALGQLTGGIAHDFNNLLTVILGNAELLTDDPSDPALTYALAKQILETAERGADLNQKLLAFGRRQSLKPERVKAETVVKDMVPLLYRTLGEQVELRTKLEATSYCALTDRTLLESAILNLAVNARDAMPGGGTLTITTGERLARRGDGPLPIGQPVIVVSVSDTGTGIAPEVLERVFEPFFTTKDAGKGSGLGLSMVFGFAQQSAGHVSIESKVGEGTTVTIVLPAVTADNPTVAHEETATPAAHPMRTSVLLVEDEPQVLQFVSTQLTSLGYKVTAVSNGHEALDLLEQGHCFDVLFTDVVLPKGLNGVEVARRASAIRPELKVLLTSGYPEEVFQQHGGLNDDTILLRKPYRRKELEHALAETLARVA